MMKLKIEKSFVDKYNGTHYPKGEEIDFEAARAKELLADQRHLVSAVVTHEAPKKPRTTKKK